MLFRSLLRLRHPSVIASRDEQRHIDRADAGHHVFHEILVAGNVDDAERVSRGGVGRCWARIFQFEPGEAEFDRDAARFFFRQSIGIDPGQRLDERALAMIDMAGGGENEAAFSIVHEL